jgi:hypothetical protein
MGHAPDDAILAKVRKLLAKAEDDACTPAEAEAFTAKAAELIAKYGIDAALLAEAEPTSDRVGDRVIVMDAPYTLDKAGLLMTVARALRCRSVQNTRYQVGGKSLTIHLFGFGADIDRVELLYTSLLVQAAHALAVEYVPYGESTAAYRRSWYAGYAHAVGRRLTAAEARAQADATRAQTSQAATAGSGRSVALVLADRSVTVTAARDAAYPKLGKARTRQLSGSGTRRGYDAGQRADLGGTRLSSARRAARSLGGGR